MSKANKIIAGLGVCAGLGVALAPFSAFALQTVTDTLQINVGDSVTFGIDIDGDGDFSDPEDTAPVTHVNGTGNHGAWGGGNNSHNYEDTLSDTMVQGQKNDALGTTELKIFASKGYQIKAQGNTVAVSASNKALPAADYSNGATGWMYKPSVSTGLTLGQNISDSEMNAAGTAQFVLASRASGASADTGDTLTVVYGAGIAASAEAGTYVGSMTYTVAFPE